MPAKRKKINKKIRKQILAFFKLDKVLLAILIVWLLMGFLIFSSAALGLMAKNNSLLSGILIKQVASLMLSFVLMLFVARIPFKKILNSAPYLYLASLLLSLLVFVPGLSFSAGGARRWIVLFGQSLQPSEFMKYSSILFITYLLLKYKRCIKDVKSLAIPAAVAALPLAILIMEPDTSTSFVIVFGLAVSYFLFGAPWKNIMIAASLAIFFFAGVVMSHPYILKRFSSFANSNQDVLGASYQINQSLIAIGSGGFFGKGYGQGVQKFGYLPEPVGDAVFATLAEEFGFFGVFVLLLLLSLFLLRSFKLAKYSRSLAASTVIVALSLTIFIQAFVNMAAMSAVLPLTGLTLPFFSLGGSSILATLLAFGVIFSAAKNSKIK